MEQAFCQSCGMPLTEDSLLSRETDGTFNEDYCKWCYTDGKFMYVSKEQLIDFIVTHIPDPAGTPEEDRRSFLNSQLSALRHWKQPE